MGIVKNAYPPKSVGKFVALGNIMYICNRMLFAKTLNCLN